MTLRLPEKQFYDYYTETTGSPIVNIRPTTPKGFKSLALVKPRVALALVSCFSRVGWDVDSIEF